MNTSNYDLKGELQAQAQLQPTRDGGVKLTKDMSIPDMVRAMAPELKKALPSVLTPERFTRIALSALNNTPQLKQCTPMSFISALLTAAQLGLEPNTPLGQAYLIPYKNKGALECQFQIGYKGLSIRRSLTSIPGQGQVFSSPKTRRSRRCIKIEPDAVELLRDYRRYQTAERFKVGQPLAERNRNHGQNGRKRPAFHHLGRPPHRPRFGFFLVSRLSPGTWPAAGALSQPAPYQRFVVDRRPCAGRDRRGPSGPRPGQHYGQHLR